LWQKLSKVFASLLVFRVFRLHPRLGAVIVVVWWRVCAAILLHVIEPYFCVFFGMFAAQSKAKQKAIAQTHTHRNPDILQWHFEWSKWRELASSCLPLTEHVK